ncbi:MAG: DUF5715 family protein [Terriglobia bacterium]|nr:DUF5715 family protein [Terriglobia bacterium]
MTRRTIISAVVAVLAAILLLPAQSYAAQSHSSRARLRRAHYRYRHYHRYRHIVWNPLLKGSHESLIRQNEEIDRLELPRIQNDAELDQLIEEGQLVQITEEPGLHIAGNLKPNRRYSKAWTRDFVEDLGQAYYEEFGSQIQLTSAVRTVDQQKKLRRRNRNAAPIEGDTASSHLAGLTVDLGKRGLTKKQHLWLENYLAKLRELGLVEVAEERRQACFHVMVSERYSDWRTQLYGTTESATTSGTDQSAPGTSEETAAQR